MQWPQLKKNQQRASELAQQVMALGAQPDDQRFILMTQVEEGEN